MKYLPIIFSTLVFLFSCATSSMNKESSLPTTESDSLTNKFHIEALKILQNNPKPVFGYRFMINGDFDGDGKQEQLVEHYYSLKTKQESNKFYDGLDDYGDLVTLAIDKDPFSFVLSNTNYIDTLMISKGSQLLGLSYLKNEGDLNGDGTDEVSYVVNWADWSNMNTWHIMTYKNKRWVELYSFPIWDWQLPDLPETFNQYGLFGLNDKMMITDNDSINQIIEKDLMAFEGLVKKIKNNKIQITFKNKEADMETKIVDLRRQIDFYK